MEDVQYQGNMAVVAAVADVVAAEVTPQQAC